MLKKLTKSFMRKKKVKREILNRKEVEGNKFEIKTFIDR